ncbi:unnamed protein product [Musa hybrid cultivar]
MVEMFTLCPVPSSPNTILSLPFLLKRQVPGPTITHTQANMARHAPLSNFSPASNAAAALFFLVALVAAVASIVNSLCTTRKHSKMAKENTDSSPSTPPKEDGELLCSEAVEEALWRKSIIMGERCRPLVFSGQILYDSQGNQLPNLAPVVPPRGGQRLC